MAYRVVLFPMTLTDLQRH